MKLVRYGRPGKEKPGLIDAAGRIRDLSEVVADIDGATLAPRVLARLAKIKPESLPAARGAPRIGPCVANVGSFNRYRPQLRRPRRRDKVCRSPRSPSCSSRRAPASWAPTTTSSSPRAPRKPTGRSSSASSSARARVTCRRRTRWLTSPAIAWSTTSRNALPEGARRRSMDQGQGLPDLRPDRPVAGHRRRDRGPAEALDVARRRRRASSYAN